MLALFLILVFAPLAFGAWCMLLPDTVPRWVLAIPLMILDVFWKAEQKAELHDNGERILWGGRPERDINYQRDQIDRAPSIADPTLVNAPNPARVRVIGYLVVGVWFAIAFFLKRLTHH